MTAKHTPGKWTIHNNIGKKSELGIIADKAPCIIAIMGNQKAYPIEAQANARHIVKCVNCHEELVEALEEAKDRITRLEGTWENAGILSEHIDQALANAQEE